MLGCVLLMPPSAVNGLTSVPIKVYHHGFNRSKRLMHWFLRTFLENCMISMAKLLGNSYFSFIISRSKKDILQLQTATSSDGRRCHFRFIIIYYSHFWQTNINMKFAVACTVAFVTSANAFAPSTAGNVSLQSHIGRFSFASYKLPVLHMTLVFALTTFTLRVLPN